ncbi:glutathione S-transferase C-terminal domain-containing protein [Bradyrhizobium sp. USDA 4473]
MKLMVDGTWRGEIPPTPELDAQRMIHAGRFRERIAPDGSSRFPAEAGRYHLYVSPACPFSHRVMVVRALKRLDAVVDHSVLHPLWDTPDGWVFGDTALSTVDRAGNGFRCLYEAYGTSSPNYTGKVTVPVLWDQRSRRIVSNESLEIAHMLNDAFNELGGGDRLDLSPPDLEHELERLTARIAKSLAETVYDVAAARDQRGYDAAMDELFGFLDQLDQQLDDGRPFLLGERPTLADVLAYPPLVRFDAVYNPLFRATRRRVADYRCLPAFVKRIHDLPGVAATTRYDHILMHYYDGDWAVTTRRGIVPDLPSTNCLKAA